MEEKLLVDIIYNAHITELVNNTHEFSGIAALNIAENYANLWHLKGGEVAYWIQVIFIGKTGYGKSTTLNKICGKELFKTDDIKSCTKTLSSALYKIHDTKNYYFSLCDLPGIGESTQTNNTYAYYYDSILKKSHCVVYLLRADKRDYSLDLQILKPMLENNEQEKKIMVAVNWVDAIKPVSLSKPFQPNQQQLENIEEKSLEIQKIFKVPQTKIFFYSATEEYNMDKISKGIIGILEKTVKHELTVAEQKLQKQAQFKTALKFGGLFLGGAAAGIAGARLYDHLKKKK